MQKLITYCLLILFSFAYSYESIKYFSKGFGDISIACLADFDCEEKNSESEKSNNKNEKLNFAEDLFHKNKLLYNSLLFGIIQPGSWGSNQNSNFSSSDYSQQVYSPPEML